MHVMIVKTLLKKNDAFVIVNYKDNDYDNDDHNDRNKNSY